MGHRIEREPPLRLGRAVAQAMGGERMGELVHADREDHADDEDPGPAEVPGGPDGQELRAEPHAGHE